MERELCKRVGILGVLLLWCLPLIVAAQPAPMPYHRRPYFIDSGLLNGSARLGDQPASAFQEVVRVPGAPWLQLRFGKVNLGSASYLLLTSLKDGAQQRFDAASLARWQNSSAFFNGDAVRVELVVSPEDQGIFFAIQEVIVGEQVDRAEEGAERKEGGLEREGEGREPYMPQMICGGVDDRVASTDPAVGRIMPIGCTGWIASNGAVLTAGHCVNANLQILQFNVPASDAFGNPIAPAPADQYPIEPLANIVSFDDGDGQVGNDWAVLDVLANANGELPIQRQGAFYRMSRDSNPATIRITGYGLDGPAPCFGEPRQPGCTNANPPRNATSQTEQTHAGPSFGEVIEGASDAFWRYGVDITGGTSGGPIIVDGMDLTLGISTNSNTVSQCTSQNSNTGTSFENDNLETAIQTFPGPNARYADNGHSIALEDGTVFRPFDTVGEAVSAVPAGGIVSIVAGAYSESLTLSKAMTLTAPVGTVHIGTATAAALVAVQETQANQDGAPEQSPAPAEEASEALPTEFGLAPNYPNPFNPTTTIRYALPVDTRVTLKVYNVLGQEIAILVDAYQTAGHQSVVWNGRSSAGLPVPSGAYLYRIVAGDFSQVKTMVLVK